MEEKVRAYISLFPNSVQESLLIVRETILSVHPSIKEGFSYKMPAYSLHKPLVYFAAYKKHIGFYPASNGIKAFEQEFISRGLKYSKGAVQFPIGSKLPLELIKNIVEYKMNETY